MLFLRRADGCFFKTARVPSCITAQFSLLLFLFFLAAPVFLFSDEPITDQEIEDLRQRIYGEDQREFLGVSLFDSSVSLFLTGSWKGSLQGNLGFSRSPLGFAFVSPETPLLFKQEADLMLSLWIKDKWFVEANFLDNSKFNTYRAGYEGFPGEFLQYAGIGNTGLDFPSFPYLDLGGDSHSSFGFYSRMETGNLNLHALIRYDSASREERIFTGGRERTYSYIQPQDMLRGMSFILPDDNIDSEITVYIEDERGVFSDSTGRRWRIARSNEYAAGKADGILELNVKPQGMAAVVYSAGADNRPWLSSMGNYNSAGSGYLSDVQQWFAFAGIDLENYPQCGNGRGVSSRPGEIELNGSCALVIYEPGTFSPFEQRNRYDAPAGSPDYASIVKLSTGMEINDFALVLMNEDFVSTDISLDEITVTRRNIYELLPVQSWFFARHPANLWPLAEIYPEIYLPGTGAFTGDIVLRFTNFNSTEGYFIGTDVVPNSVQVWRSGVQDTNFNFNSSSGEVNLYAPTGNNELIRITFLKRSEDAHLGSIAAGFGVEYGKSESPFSASGALGIRWNLTENSGFTEEGVYSPGTAGLSGEAAWDYDFFKARITAGLSFEQTDTTGLYRIEGMEGSETILVLPPEGSFLSHPPGDSVSSPSLFNGLDSGNRAGLIYRNYYNNNALGSALMPVTWNGAQVIPGQNRPYPAKDPDLGGTQTLVGDFFLGANKWTGFEVPIGNNSGIISHAGEIEIPFRIYDFTGNDSDLKIIIQIGSLSGKDYIISENPELILERPLFPGFPDANNFYNNPGSLEGLRIARFTLTDEDRIKLGEAQYLRIIIVNEGPDNLSGRVILAPPVISGSRFRPVTYNGTDVIRIDSSFPSNRVTIREITETGTEVLEAAYGDIIKRLHPLKETQRVLNIEWFNMESGISAGADKITGELPFSDYRQLSFFVKRPADMTSGVLNFIAAAGSGSISGSQLEARIPIGELRAGQWSKVTIRYQGNNTGVTIDGKTVTGASFSYNQTRTLIDRYERRTNYLIILVESDSLPPLPDGNIYIDEIILEDSLLVYRMNAGGIVEYSKRGNILNAGGIPMLADFYVFSAIESELRLNGNYDGGVSGSAVTRTGTEFLFFGATVQMNLSSVIAKDSFYFNESHNISRSIGMFSVKESFSASPRNKTSRRNLAASFSNNFYTRFNADALLEYSRLRQIWNLDFGYNPADEFIPSLAVKTEALWTGRKQLAENDNYAKLWLNTWEYIFPNAGRGAESRRAAANISLTEKTRPVGAVITLEGITNFSGVNNTTRLEHSLFFNIPVALDRAAINIGTGRVFRRNLNFSGKDILDDSAKFFESVNDFMPVWGAFPLYSLFSNKLNGAVKKTIDNSPSKAFVNFTSVSDQFYINLNFNAVYDLSAFLIPSRASIRLERMITQRLDTATDTLNFSGGVGFSAINMFGVMGYKPLFDFYQNDEYSYGIDGTAIFNGSRNIPWRIRTVLGAGFRGFEGSVLNFLNTLTFGSGQLWLENLSVSWTAPTKNSLLSYFYDWIVKIAIKQNSWLKLNSLLSSDYEQMRRESLEMTIDKTGGFLRFNITAGHESTVRILVKLDLTAFAKLRFQSNAYSEILIFDIQIGTSLRINF